MAEIVDSRWNRGLPLGRIYYGNLYMTQEEREERLALYHEIINSFDWDNPVCLKCNNVTFNGFIYHEKGWIYYHCACGFQIHREIKLDTTLRKLKTGVKRGRYKHE
jgi:lysyl-tRNA synthetase class I